MLLNYSCSSCLYVLMVAIDKICSGLWENVVGVRSTQLLFGLVVISGGYHKLTYCRVTGICTMSGLNLW